MIPDIFLLLPNCSLYELWLKAKLCIDSFIFKLERESYVWLTIRRRLKEGFRLAGLMIHLELNHLVGIWLLSFFLWINVVEKAPLNFGNKLFICHGYTCVKLHFRWFMKKLLFDSHREKHLAEKLISGLMIVLPIEVASLSIGIKPYLNL